MNDEMSEAEPERAAPVCRRDLDEPLVIDIFSTSAPSLAGVLGIARSTAYEYARSGAVPTVKVGRLVKIPVARLLTEVLGERPHLTSGQMPADETAGQGVTNGTPHAMSVRPLTNEPTL